MPTLILLRHGESVWNRDNLFTGWTDVDLSDRGVEEARQAARLIAAEGISFDLCFTSVQKRAIRTLWIVLDELDLLWMPVQRHWRLNERHYGALQGQNKDEKRKEVGEEQVHEWRRSFATRPPAPSSRPTNASRAATGGMPCFRTPKFREPRVFVTASRAPCPTGACALNRR